MNTNNIPHFRHHHHHHVTTSTTNDDNHTNNTSSSRSSQQQHHTIVTETAGSSSSPGNNNNIGKSILTTSSESTGSKYMSFINISSVSSSTTKYLSNNNNNNNPNRPQNLRQHRKRKSKKYGTTTTTIVIDRKMKILFSMVGILLCIGFILPQLLPVSNDAITRRFEEVKFHRTKLLVTVKRILSSIRRRKMGYNPTDNTNNNNNNMDDIHTKRPRIAIIIPYSSGLLQKNNNNKNNNQNRNHHNNRTNDNNDDNLVLPTYLLTFCAGAVGSIDIIDFLIFYISSSTSIYRYNNKFFNNNNTSTENKNTTTTTNDYTYDWYDDDIERLWPDIQRYCPSNVQFIPLSPIEMAQHFVRVVDDKYTNFNNNNKIVNTNVTNNTDTHNDDNNNNNEEEDTPLLSYSNLIDLIAKYILINPYGIVEFKPAFGTIFHDYIQSYSHWGYTDLDILFGDMSRWITYDELYDHDIVTYTFGDQERIYLRGQLTIHKNIPTTINQLWKNCSYLTNMDIRFYNMITKQQKYRVESAEGCYSTTVFRRNDISVKYAVKAWTDIQPTDTVYSHGLFLSRSSSSAVNHQVIHKVHPNFLRNNNKNNTQLIRTDANWFFNTKSMYYNHSIPMQRQVGELIPIDLDVALVKFDNEGDNNNKRGCMYWVKEQYQSQLCLRPGTVSSSETVYWINGQLYKQPYENTMEVLSSGRIMTGPFFHFQEWKRSYRYGQLVSFHPKSKSDLSTIILTPDGAIPMIDPNAVTTTSSSSSSYKFYGNKKKNIVASSWGKLSPLGLQDMTKWHGIQNDNRDQLPGHIYCLRTTESRSSSGKAITKCEKSISWLNRNAVHILLAAPGWKYDSIYQTKDLHAMDVTLVVTLELVMDPTHVGAESTILDHLLDTLRRWQGQPSVVIVVIAGTPTLEIQNLLEEKLLSGSETFHESTLLAVIYGDLEYLPTDNNSNNGDENDSDKPKPSNGIISRKALLNMAIDAVPTRWYVSGIELERGLTISLDTVSLAHQKASSHSRLRGHVFWIPQFGLVDNTRNDSNNHNTDAAAIVHTNEITLKDLSEAEEIGKIKNLFEFEEGDCAANYDDGQRHFSSMTDTWWNQTKDIVSGTRRSANDREFIIDQAAELDEFDSSILDIAITDENSNNQDHIRAIDESPILLIDNYGPFVGIRTNEIVREVEEFIGLQCYNGLRIVQLSILGYKFDVLAGAFAISSETSRQLMLPLLQHKNDALVGKDSSTGLRCHQCSLSKPSLIFDIVQSEIERVTKTAIVWAETATDSSPLPQ